MENIFTIRLEDSKNLMKISQMNSSEYIGKICEDP